MNRTSVVLPARTLFSTVVFQYSTYTPLQNVHDQKSGNFYYVFLIFNIFFNIFFSVKLHTVH